MPEIIEQIIDIDRLAQEKLDQAQLREQENETLLEEKKEAIRADFKDKLQTVLADLTRAEEMEIHNQESAIQADTKEKIEMLDATYQQNHNVWEKDILTRMQSAEYS